MIKVKIGIKYILILGAALAIVYGTFGFLAAISIRCAMSLGCGGEYNFVLLLPILLLLIIVGIGYKVLKLRLAILIVIVFILPIPLIYAFSSLQTWYMKYSDIQLLRSAVSHKQNIVLHKGIIFPIDMPKDLGDNFITLHVIVPFEVTANISSKELPYMFASVKLSNAYSFSSKPICNNDFYASINREGNTYLSYTEGQLFSSNGNFFLDGPEPNSLSDIALYDYQTKEARNVISKNRKPSVLLPGKTYYIYNYITIRSSNCIAADFFNPNLTNPPIFVQ